MRDIAQDSLAQLDPTQVLTIGPEGDFAKGAAIDVIKELAGQLAPGQLSVITDRRRGKIKTPVSST